eukprot:14399751-Alexandrium_andersonii.AAC.1
MAPPGAPKGVIWGGPGGGPPGAPAEKFAARGLWRLSLDHTCQCPAFLVLICCSDVLDVAVALVAHFGSSLVGARRAPRRAVSAR